MPPGVPGDPGSDPAWGPGDTGGAGDGHGDLAPAELLPDKRFGTLWFPRQPEPRLCQRLPGPRGVPSSARASVATCPTARHLGFKKRSFLLANKKLSGRLFGQDFHETIWWGVLKIKGGEKTPQLLTTSYGLCFQEGSLHPGKLGATRTLPTTGLEQAQSFPTSHLPSWSARK